MTLHTETIDGFLESLAAKRPTPGGGAVASVVAALAASLGEMVVQYSVGKKKLIGNEQLHTESIERLAALRHAAVNLATEDAEAYHRLSELMKLEEDDERRRREWVHAVAAAIDTPRRMLDLCGELSDLLERLAGRTNAMLDSDLAISAILTDAATRSAAWNVRINLALLPPDEAQTLRAAIDGRVEQILATCTAVEQSCRRA